MTEGLTGMLALLWGGVVAAAYLMALWFTLRRWSARSARLLLGGLARILITAAALLLPVVMAGPLHGIAAVVGFIVARSLFARRLAIAVSPAGEGGTS